MSKYRVEVEAVVNAVLEIEADSAEEAAEKWYDKPGRSLGLMFLDHQYADVSDWEAVAVDDEGGNEVLSRKDLGAPNWVYPR